MSSKPTNAAKGKLPLSILTKVAGGHVPLLPGESADEYREGLAATIAELEATTPLQIYLAEKIFDCMWWIRRLEAQKTELILYKAWEQLNNKLQKAPDRSVLTEGNWSDPYLIAAAKTIGHTVESLLNQAIQFAAGPSAAIDGRIADRIKAMQGLQSAYESLVNRKLVVERLRLQNESLKRDLAAIEVLPTTK